VRRRSEPAAAAPAAAPIQVLHTPKRIRGILCGEVVVDSRRALLLREPGRVPVYYFPPEEVRADLLRRTGEVRQCPRKGSAVIWNVSLADRLVPEAAWSYERPASAARALRGLIAFDWDALDAWFEEDEQVHVHPRDPFTRLDILASSREIEVIIGGEAVAESRRPVMLLETGLRPRYYLPMLDVWGDRLVPSSLVTQCPYKGEAHYYHVRVGGRLYENLVWYYPYPTLEANRIANMLCFYDERVDRFLVDGVALAK
jgi:uncharacterized protein (DUF427 family)